jgi:MerR family transcriptional regulator, heat shock protein HspR
MLGRAATVGGRCTVAGLERLDDEDYPSVSMGRAAELLGVQPAFLRSLDTAGVLAPHRIDGGHRRYSRRQLAYAQRLRELIDGGHTVTSAGTIVDVEDRIALSEVARRTADDDRDQAHRDRDTAAAERDHAVAEHRRSAAQHQRTVVERDTAQTQLRQRTDQPRQAQHELDQARQEIQGTSPAARRPRRSRPGTGPRVGVPPGNLLTRTTEGWRTSSSTTSRPWGRRPRVRSAQPRAARPAAPESALPHVAVRAALGVPGADLAGSIPSLGPPGLTVTLRDRWRRARGNLARVLVTLGRAGSEDHAGSVVVSAR